MKTFKMNSLSKVTALLALSASVMMTVPASAQERPEDRFDGGGSTGGGNAVVCFDDAQIPAAIKNPANPDKGEILDAYLPHITRITALDLEEARMGMGLSGTKTDITPAPTGMEVFAVHVPYRQWIDALSEKFSHTLPGIQRALYGASQTFTPQNTRYQPHGVAKVDDTKSVGRAADNCVLATVIVQKKLGAEVYFDIDERLFKHAKHELLSRLVLLMHEHFYMKLRERGQTDSESARRFVGMIISENSGMTVASFIRQANQFGFKEFGTHTTFPFQLAVNGANVLNTAADRFLSYQTGTFLPVMGPYLKPVKVFLDRLAKDNGSLLEILAAYGNAEMNYRRNNAFKCHSLEECRAILAHMVDWGSLVVFAPKTYGFGWTQAIQGGLVLSPADRKYVKDTLLPSIERALQYRAGQLRKALESALEEHVTKFEHLFSRVHVECHSDMCFGDVQKFLQKRIDSMVSSSDAFSLLSVEPNGLTEDLSKGLAASAERWAVDQNYYLHYPLK